MPESQEIAELLRKLKSRLIAGDIDEATYHRQREILLSDLTPGELAMLGLTPSGATPRPGTPRPGSTGVSPRPSARPFGPGGSPRQVGPAGSPRPLGPSGGRGGAIGTRLGESLASLDFKRDDVIVGKFRVIRELGRGGFGAVYEAERVGLGKTYAVKVLDPAMVVREELLARFRREVIVMQSLVHTHIGRVYDYDERTEEGLALFAMELVKGCSAGALHQRMREQNQDVPVLLVARILHQTLDALAEAHRQGVIHRDVTPANLLLATDPDKLLADPTGDPCVKLIDFGIAGLLERTELSQKSRALGTAAYVAPEVLDPNVEVTAAADVYGAGAVAYHLLTNALPLGRFKAPREHRRDVPEEFDELILALLETAPGDRPSAEDAHERLDDLLPDLADGGQARREANARAQREREERERRDAEARAAKAEAERQAEEERRRANPSPLEVRRSSKDGLEYVFIPPGEFEMGASPGDDEAGDDEKPRHRVRITRGFWLGRTPVTVEAYRRFCEATGREMPVAPDFNEDWQHEDHPIVNVSWEDAAAYCEWAGGRLPTEAEWEYAARGGTTQRCWWGKEFDEQKVWCRRNSDSSTQRGGTKPANPWQLQDVLGNVWEWCADWYDGDYYASSSVADPEGPSSGDGRVVRGGSWVLDPWYLRVSYRGWGDPGYWDVSVGFRCARDVFP